MKKTKQAGITIIELLIVVSIIGILVLAAGFSFEGWMGNYKIECETKQIFSDLIDARVRALTVHRTHFVIMDNTGYEVYDDTFPAIDGNEVLDTDSDNLILRKRLDGYELTNAGVSELPIKFSIDTRGLIYPQRDILIVHKQNPDYDCIAITQSRIRMAKYNGSKCIDK